MNRPETRGHGLRKRVLELLEQRSTDTAVAELCRLPLRSAVNPLFSLIQHGNERVKWAAVAAMGAVVAKLADLDMEAARVVMRRLMWSLNDESGGIGWGSPEAMAEILARHHGLAREYAHILISYAREDGNYLENETLQSGLLWGIGRLCEERPELAKGAIPHLMPYLSSPNPTHRGLAARIMGLLRVPEARKELERLAKDEAGLMVFLDGNLEKCKVGELAESALAKLG